MGLLDEARILIKSYLDGGGQNRNISYLARRSNTPYSTLRRIVQNETNNVTIETLIPILSIIMTQNELTDLISKHSCKWKNFFEYLKSNEYEIWHKDEDFIWEEIDIYIIALASCQSGVSKERVAKDYGEKIGLKRLEILEEVGLIREINGKYQTFKPFFVDPEPKSVLKRIELHAKSFNLNNIGLGAFYQYHVRQVSDEGLKEIGDLTRDYIEKVSSVCESAPGKKDKVFILNMLGNFKKGEEL